MRKEFCNWAEKESRTNPKLIFLTGDLGYNALEEVSKILGPRFINMGVCEQNMISVGAGLAHEGWEVICYSIAPFATFRPAEQIRLDVCIHNKNVKIVGNGGGYGYGIMGSTHHALEDLAVLSSFPNISCLIPRSNEDVLSTCTTMMKRQGPAYLRLNGGSEAELKTQSDFSPVRRMGQVNSSKLVLVGLGPMAIHLYQAALNTKISAQTFSVSELPLTELGQDFLQALATAHHVLIAEEHVARGGLAENLVYKAALEGICIKKMTHRFAVGTPNGFYGSQKYHLDQSGLSVSALEKLLLGAVI